MGIKASLTIAAIRSVSGGLFSRLASISRIASSSTSLSLKIRTALIGSPTYLEFLNFTDLTKPFWCNSNPGITRILFIRDGRNFQGSSYRIYGFFRDETEHRIYCHSTQRQ